MKRIVVAGLIAAAAATWADAAAADRVVARWIQLGPGSSAAALAEGSYGDEPLSLTPTILARAIVPDGTCPTLKVDFQLPLTMHARFDGAALTHVPGTPGATNGKAGYPQYFVRNTTPTNFPNGSPMATTGWTECEAVVPPGHRMASIGDVSLKLPAAHPRRILVLADTGCRMDGALAADGSNQQNCSNPSAFPLAYLARFEASMQPDLIVHVGDWLYRDTDCRNSFPGCGNRSSQNYETWGDTFDGWNADVFFPAGPLLAAAPWIMARGNHESCGRGARGWFALLDPRPYSYAQVSCAGTRTYPPPVNGRPTYAGDFTPTYIVPADNVNFLVHDSSFAKDGGVDRAMARNYDLDLTRALGAVGSRSMNIFATHKPSFGLVFGRVTTTGAGTVDNAGDFTEQAVFSGGTYAGSAFVNGVPQTIGLFLSGHIHQFQFATFQDWRRFAPQLIVGVGGTLLGDDMNTGLVPNGVTDVPPLNQTAPAFVVNEYSGATAFNPATRAYSHDEFGFAVLDAITDAAGQVRGYTAQVYKISTERSGTCTITLKPRDITCDF